METIRRRTRGSRRDPGTAPPEPSPDGSAPRTAVQPPQTPCIPPASGVVSVSSDMPIPQDCTQPPAGPASAPAEAPLASPKEAPEENNVMLFWQALQANPWDEQKAKDYVKKQLTNVLKQHGVADTYNVLVFFDDRSIARVDADRIYKAVTSFPSRKPILLVLYSDGGSISAAYLIAKLCREYSSGTFAVAVPRRAKSAATLICCGADVLHMGSLSELGPIDPQIDDSPALGLKYAVEHLADLVKRYPAASEMFATYLHQSLKLINLGYYERVAESAVQYAERLLSPHRDALRKIPAEIAQHLVYLYKDHGFVIDRDEAQGIFGDRMVKANTPEYRLGNQLYETLSLLEAVSHASNFNIYLVGAVTSDCELQRKKKPGLPGT